MGGSPFYSTSPFDPFFLRPASPPPLRRPRSVISIPVSDPSSPSPSPAPRLPPPIHPSVAAATIQSRYRGFAVRRRTPLLHLRTIASVQRRLDLLYSDLQRPDFASTIRRNEKAKVKFAESIMASLLQLDAIEGAIPEVRSRRKQTTRKAIQLQESMDAVLQGTEQEPELDATVGEAFDANGKDFENLFAAAMDSLTDVSEEAGRSSPALSMELVHSVKNFSPDDKLDASPTRNGKGATSQQESDQEQMVKTMPSKFSAADSNSEEMRRSFRQTRSALPTDLGINVGTEKVIGDDCTIEDDTGDVNVPEECSFSAIGENGGEKDGNLDVGRRLDDCTTCCTGEDSIVSTNCGHCRMEDDIGDHCLAAEAKLESLEVNDAENGEMSYSKQAIAKTHVSPPSREVYHEQSTTSHTVGEGWTPNQIEKPDGPECKAENHEMELSNMEACEGGNLSLASSTQEVNVDNGKASEMLDVTAIASLPSNSSQQEERMLLEQLSEDSKHMKKLLAKMYIQSRKQNQIIDSLNKKVEKLEHLLHRQRSKNSKLPCKNKHIRRKEKMWAGKYGVSHDEDLQMYSSPP